MKNKKLLCIFTFFLFLIQTSFYLHTSTRPSAHPTRSKRAVGIRATPATRREDEEEEEEEEELLPLPLPPPGGATTRTLASERPRCRAASAAAAGAAPVGDDPEGGSAAIKAPP